MSNIKDIVEQVREIPSPRCWESIASQLAAAGATVGGGAAATTAKSTMAAGKLAAIIGSAAAVVTVVTVATVSLLKNEPVSENQSSAENPTQIIVTDSILKDNTEIYLVESEIATQKPNLNQTLAGNANEKANSVVTSSSTPASSTETTPASVNNIQTNPTIHTNSSPSLVSTPAPSSNTQNPTVNTNTQTSQSHNKAEKNTDKTEEYLPETNDNPEDFGYSRPVVIEIPNVFTPNGDGVNDLFVINGIEHCDKRLLIVKNQKGETVFQSNLYDNNWDGTNLPDGSYFYQFMYSINNINEVRKGIVLIRR